MESFNGRLRDGLLNRELFLSVPEARYVLAQGSELADAGGICGVWRQFGLPRQKEQQVSVAWDRVHPDQTGHAIIARAFFQALEYR